MLVEADGDLPLTDGKTDHPFILAVAGHSVLIAAAKKLPEQRSWSGRNEDRLTW